MEAVILKCRPNAQFHFGKIALDVNTSLSDTANVLHSDTLFSALIVTLNTIFPEHTKRFIDFFKGGEKLKISSGFYCVEHDGGYTYFLPKPIHYNLQHIEKDEKDEKVKCIEKTDRKMLKKVQFISKDVWEQGLLPKEWPEKCLILQKRFVITKDEALAIALGDKWQDFELYSEHTLPKVSVHKLTKEDNLYNQTNIQIADNRKLDLESTPAIHLYFLLDQELEEGDYSIFQTILSVLEDTGIGGERNVGCGRIEKVDYRDFQYDVQDVSDMQCMLSLVNPTAQDLPNLKWYNVITRGGRKTANHGVLKRVKMLLEGGIAITSLDGQIPAIHDNGLFLRCGKSLSLPVSQKTITNEISSQSNL